MCPSAIPEPADSGTMGYYGVLWRVHEPLLASLFWLALGSVLGWPDAVGGPMPAAGGRVREGPSEAMQKQSRAGGHHPRPAHPVHTQAKRVRQPRGTRREGRVALRS
jgi:hypothetical protein